MKKTLLFIILIFVTNNLYAEYLLNKSGLTRGSRESIYLYEFYSDKSKLCPNSFIAFYTLNKYKEEVCWHNDGKNVVVYNPVIKNTIIIAKPEWLGDKDLTYDSLKLRYSVKSANENIIKKDLNKNNIKQIEFAIKQLKINSEKLLKDKTYCQIPKSNLDTDQWILKGLNGFVKSYLKDSSDLNKNNLDLSRTEIEKMEWNKYFDLKIDYDIKNYYFFVFFKELCKI